MTNQHLDFDINTAVKFANNERILSSYEGFETIDPVGKGYFIVTNFRFIYIAVSKDKLSSSVAVTEWDIFGIGGIESEFGKRVKVIQRIIGFLFLISGFAGIGYALYRIFNFNLLFSSQLSLFIAGGSALIVSLFLFIFGKKQMFSLEILKNTDSSSLVSFNSSFFRSPNKGKILINPSRSTLPMIRELGQAIIEAKQFPQYQFNNNINGESNAYRR